MLNRIKFFLIVAVLLLTQSLVLMAQKNSSDVNYMTVNDLPYSVKTDSYARERLKVDVYYPQTLKDCPVIVWFHGGGLTSGHKGIPVELKKKGLVVIGVNYRLLPNVTIDSCLDDATEAVAWTFRHAKEYNGDCQKIFVTGHSAGGYLTMMVGLVRNLVPPMVLITGDRNMELFGRYEENAYLWRMLKLCGHEESYLYELGGHDHGAMMHPAFHILLDNINRILDRK